MHQPGNQQVSTEPDKHQTREPATQDQEVGQRIRAAREALHLTQSAVSTRSRMADAEGKGISRTALVGYENGSSRPGLREVRLLCIVLKVSANWLVFGTEEAYQATHAGLEAVRTANKLRDALRAGIAISALKGHERDALLSLALSLAGRQLGDLRLSGLLAFVGLISDELEAILWKYLPQGSNPTTLEELIDVLSEGMVSNYGTRIHLDEDGDPATGEWTYQDPKVEKPNK
jgi:transcriptional regulator with XRE-family HTH domain